MKKLTEANKMETRDYTITELVKLYNKLGYKTSRGDLHYIKNNYLNEEDFYLRAGVLFINESGKVKFGEYYRYKYVFKKQKVKK